MPLNLLYATLFVLTLPPSVCGLLEHLDFVSDCSPYKNSSCSIRCELYQCVNSSCDFDQKDESACEQNVRIRNSTGSGENFVELFDPPGVIAGSFMFELSRDEIPNLTRIVVSVDSMAMKHPLHFMALFSPMQASDFPIFTNEVILEFPITGIERESDVELTYSTNICSSSKREVFTVPKYLVDGISLVRKYHPHCSGVRFVPATADHQNITATQTQSDVTTQPDARQRLNFQEIIEVLELYWPLIVVLSLMAATIFLACAGKNNWWPFDGKYQAPTRSDDETTEEVALQTVKSSNYVQR